MKSFLLYPHHQEQSQSQHVRPSTVLGKICYAFIQPTPSYGKFSSWVTFVWLLLLFNLPSLATCQDCLHIEQNQCVKCPQNAHLYNNFCYWDILHCKSYRNGSLCQECQDGSQLKDDRKSCTAINVEEYGLVFSASLDPRIKLSPQFYSSIVSSVVAYPINEDQQIQFTQVALNSYDEYYAKDLLLYMKQYLENKTSTQNLSIQNLYIQNKVSGTKDNLSEVNKGNYFRAILSTKLQFVDVLFKVSAKFDVNAVNMQTGSIAVVANFNPASAVNGKSSVSFTLFELKIFERKMGVNSSSDRIAQQIKIYVGQEYSDYRSAEIRQTFKKVNATTTQYTILLYDRNYGLNQITVQIQNSYIKAQQKDIQLKTMPSHLLKILNMIASTVKYAHYLKETRIYSLTKILSQIFPTYNISFIDKIKPSYSYIVFQIDTSTKSIRIRDTFMSLQKSLKPKTIQSNSKFLQKSFVSSFLSTIDIQESIQPPKSFLPNNKTINVQNTSFSEELDLTKFRKSPTFSTIRLFLQKNNPLKVLNYELVRLLTIQNDTTVVFHLVFKVDGLDRTNAYYTFALDIQSKALELVELYEVPQARRSIIKVSNLNRNQAIQNSTTDQLNFYQNLIYEPYHDFSALFIESRTMNYSMGINGTIYNGILYPEEKSVIQYVFKYYYPPSLGKSYEYIEFRYVVQTFYPNKQNPLNNFITDYRVRRSIGIVIIPKENFVYSGPNNTFTQKQIQLYMAFQLDKINIKDFQIIEIRQSMLRNRVFRVIVQTNESIFLYQIDLTGNLQPFILSIRKNTSVQMFSDFQYKLFPLSGGYTSPLPKNLKNFSQRKMKVENIIIKPLTDKYVDFQTQLTTTAIKHVISELFLSTNVIEAIQIVKRQTVCDIIDLYTVDYNDRDGLIEGITTRKRIQFAIPKFSNLSEQVAMRLERPAAFMKNEPILLGNMFDNNSFPVLTNLTTAASSVNSTNITNATNTATNTISKPSLKITDQRLKLFLSSFKATKTLALATKSSITISKNYAYSPFKRLVYFLFDNYSKYSLSKYFGSTKATNLSSLPREDSPSPLSQASQQIMKLFESTNANISITAQRKTQTNPPIVIVDFELKSLKDYRSAPPTLKLRAWLSEPEYTVLNLEMVDNGYDFQVQIVDDKFLMENDFISRIEDVIASEIEEDLDNIVYKDILPQNKYKRKYITPANLISLRSQKVGEYQKVQFIYQLKEVFIKALVYASFVQQKFLQIHIVSITMHSNGIKDLQDQNKAFTDQQITKVRNTSQMIEIQWQIFKQFGHIVDQKIISNIDLKQLTNEVLVNLRYDYKNVTYSGRFIYNKTTKRVLVVSLEKQPANEIINSRVDANPQLIKGCKKRTIAGPRECSQCQPSYDLGKDKQCYPKMKNCVIQSGALCITCKSGYFFDTSFKCI